MRQLVNNTCLDTIMFCQFMIITSNLRVQRTPKTFLTRCGGILTQKVSRKHINYFLELAERLLSYHIANKKAQFVNENAGWQFYTNRTMLASIVCYANRKDNNGMLCLLMQMDFYCGIPVNNVYSDSLYNNNQL